MTTHASPPGAGVLPRRGGLPRTAVAVAACSGALAVAALVLQAVSGVDLLLGDLLFIVVDAVVALVYGTVGAVILWRRPHVVGWLTALAGIGGGLAALGGAWRSMVAAFPELPALDLLQAAYGIAWVPGTIGLFVLVPWFVRERPLTPGAWGGVAGGVVTIVVFLGTGLLGYDDARPGLALVVAWGLVTAGATCWRHRHGPPDERRGLGLLAAGTAIMALSFAPLLVTWDDPDVYLAVPLTHLAVQAMFPAAILVSVLRNRLWGLDLVVSRATVAALLAVGLALVYVALLAGVSALVGNRPLAQVVAVVGVALAVQPVRSWLHTRVQRLVYGESRDPGGAALRLGQHLSSARTADELLTGLAAAIRESLRLESVLLVSGGPSAEVPPEPAASPAVGHGSLTLPVLHGGQQVGELTVTPRAGERLDPRTRDTLAQLLPVVAVGLALAQGAHDLERARDATTRARLTERQVIRRELHDGIGPWLSGLRLGLQGARNSLPADPGAAVEVLDALQREVVQRVEDVRVLSRSLLPPVLDELGLEAALAELVERHAQAGFAVELRCAPCPGLDPRVAAAAYAIASEAVLNAARHSGAPGARVGVDLVQTAPGRRSLVVTCDDAGSGLPVGVRPGVGTRSMHERAAELGGTVEAVALDPGTRVRAVLPVPAGLSPTGRAPRADETPDDTPQEVA